MKRRIKRHIPRRPVRRERPVAAIVCAALIVVGAWLLSWWIVPLAALVVAAIWRERPNVVAQVTWGAVAGWAVLLLVDSLHGRSWALARAAGGVMFLPWGLLFPVTLLFAAGLAWSVGVLIQEITTKLGAEGA